MTECLYINLLEKERNKLITVCKTFKIEITYLNANYLRSVYLLINGAKHSKSETKN